MLLGEATIPAVVTDAPREEQMVMEPRREFRHTGTIKSRSAKGNSEPPGAEV